MTNAQSANTITALATTTTSPTNRLYYGDNLGIVRKVDNADSGNGSGVSDISGSAFPSGYVSNIAVNPEDGNELIVTFSNYSVKSIWHSNDAGATWSDISGNLEENSDGSGNGPSVRSALILKHKSTQMYFVGTSTGLYSTTSLNGTSTTWVHEGAQSIGNVVVDALAGRESDGYIAVATHGAGVFTVNLNDNSKPAITAVTDVLIDEDGSSTVTLSGTDPDGDALTYSAVSDTNAVTVSISSTTLTLTPKADWNGVANITAYTSDGTETDSTKFKLTVTPVDDIASVQDETIDEDNSTDVTLTSTFTAATTFTAVSDTNGVATTISSSKLTLTPTANWYGVANIKAYASDGTSTDSISFNLTVNPVQDAPTAFEWVSSTLDTININKTNTADIYGMEWDKSIDLSLIHI